MDTYYYEQSDKALTGPVDLLRQAGVSFTVHRAVGPVAETIVNRARELECDALRRLGLHRPFDLGCHVRSPVAHGELTATF